jgi:hypothetical protein
MTRLGRDVDGTIAPCAFLHTTNLYSPSLVLSISNARLLEDCEHGLVLANLQILAPSFRHCCSPRGWRRCCSASAPLPAPVVAFRLILLHLISFFFCSSWMCAPFIHGTGFSSSPGIERRLLNVEEDPRWQQLIQFIKLCIVR